MKIKSLGNQGLKASEIGLGCMGMSEFMEKKMMSNPSRQFTERTNWE